jgi:lysine 6-dehydrogenase
MKILVLGGGAQGSAAAFDLAHRPEVTSVVMADLAIDDPKPFLRPFVGERIRLERVDATDERQVLRVMEGVDATVCALPYYMNLAVTRMALMAGCHYCDLGGNTELVEQQKSCTTEAASKGISIVPDCGLAPGMVNILAEAGIQALDEVDTVKIRVGGLPQNPEPPLNYQIVYSLHGAIDYMTNPALVLRDYEPAWKDPLTGVETVAFPEPVGELEAFFTAGGISTQPLRHKGKVRDMDYKTLRYPGHAELMMAIRELGLLDMQPVRVGDCDVAPREAFIQIVSPRLRKPGSPDLVALSVDVVGRKGGRSRKVRYELLDLYDAENGITAMMRTTGYSLAVTGVMQADGRIPPGAHTPDECVPAADYVAELAKRGVKIERTEGEA